MMKKTQVMLSWRMLQQNMTPRVKLTLQNDAKKLPLLFKKSKLM